jgi:hypothetical protein
MYSMDDLKENRDAQITVACIAFFLIAFPTYFSIAADGADGSLGGGVGDYQVNGEVTYIELDSGSEFIGNGESWEMTYNTEDVNDAEDLNIVGIRISMSYNEDEDGGDAPGCTGSAAPDTITGVASHLEFTGSANGQNADGSGSHEAMAVWYNESMVGAVISGLSMNEIKAQIDSMGAGLGDHSVSISVDAQSGNEPPFPLCTDQRSDDGETVDYTVELMVYDYTIVPYIEIPDE